jgi:acetolactate synthase I/II/III large subunit
LLPIQQESYLRVPSTTCADHIASALTQAGVRFVFGVPGGAIEPFFDALARSADADELQCVVARHEGAALAMAEGSVREGAALGVCCATTGPGALNMMSASASALMEQQPLLILTGQAPLAKLGQGPMQDSSCDAVDVVAAFKTVTKYSTLVSHPDQVIPKMLRALTIAQCAPCGPVHLSIPSDVLSALLPSGPMRWQAPRPPVHSASADDTEDVRSRLTAAKAPVVVLGELAEKAREEVRAFVEAWQIPVVAMAAGHRWFPTTHPLFQGVHGFAGHTQAAEVVRAADCVLVLGSLHREFCGGNAPYLHGPHVIVAADTCRDLTTNPAAGTYVCADIAHLLKSVGRPLEHRPPFTGVPFQAPRELDETSLKLSPIAALLGLHALLPLNSHVYLDAGNAWSWGLHYMPINEQVTRLVTSMGYGQMAWAIPTSIGAAFERQEDTGVIVCVTGDGSWLMSSHELTVAVQNRLKVVFVILNDAHLGMVYHGQRMTGARAIGHELPPIDFAAMARACGAAAKVVTRLEDLGRLPEMLETLTGPLVLDFRVDAEVVPPMRARVDQLRQASGRELSEVPA